MSPLPLERQHDSLVGIVFGERLAHPAIVRPEHPEQYVSLASIGPAKVSDLVLDLNAKRLPDELSTHTRFPAPRMQACGGGGCCDSASGKSTETNLCLVAPAQRIGIAA